MRVYSLGSSPTGPLTSEPSPADALEHCQLGTWTIASDDIVVGDLDGVVILPTARLHDLIAAGTTIRQREQHQAVEARQGTTLRQQFDFDAYLARRDEQPAYTFRQHLTGCSASIEE